MMADLHCIISVDTSRARRRIKLLEQWIALGLYADWQHGSWVRFISSGIEAVTSAP